jgi:hypothetical protein
MRRRLSPIRAVAYRIPSPVLWLAFLSSCVAMRLTLRFDGSLRAAPAPPKRVVLPNDVDSMSLLSEHDFFATPSSSVAWHPPPLTEPTVRIAACAASLHLDGGIDDNCSNHQRIVALGGRLLDSSDVGQSGQAEYEGLLLGLTMLSDWIESLGDMQLMHGKPVAVDTVRIQGDCKTVIEQVRGRSRPRKLEAYWSQASSLICRVKAKCNFKNSSSAVLVAEHIPRRINGLCDGVASHIVLRQHGVNSRKLWTALESYPQLLDTSSAPTLTELLHDVKRLIPYWVRPTFYIRLAAAAWNAGAYREVASAGQRIETEIKGEIAAHRRRTAGGPNAARRTELADLHARSVMLQIVGSTVAGQSRESDRLYRRHKHALDEQPELVRAMDQVVDKTASLSDAVQHWIDLSLPKFEEGPVIHPNTTQEERAAVDEWSRLAFISKDWNETGAYILRFQ